MENFLEKISVATKLSDYAEVIKVISYKLDSVTYSKSLNDEQRKALRKVMMSVYECCVELTEMSNELNKEISEKVLT